MFVFFAAELYTVAIMNGYSTLQINNYVATVLVLSANFLLAYSIMNQLTPWLHKKQIVMQETEE
jgi:hypothetical protein